MAALSCSLVMEENQMEQKMQATLSLRLARPEDAAALAAIYAPYVEKTAISFEHDAPSVEDFRRRMETVLETYPYLVAQAQGVPVGYAYASPFAERAAYDWAAEVAVYLAPTWCKGGLWRRLYALLENLLCEMNVQNLYAKVAWPTDGSDEYLTENSAEFHAHVGYRLAGELRACGYKFGRWYGLRCFENTSDTIRRRCRPWYRFPVSGRV